jgi:hypothetical protein
MGLRDDRVDWIGGKVQPMGTPFILSIWAQPIGTLKWSFMAQPIGTLKWSFMAQPMGTPK